MFKAIATFASAAIVFLAVSTALAEIFSYEIVVLEQSGRRLLAHGDKTYSVEDTVVTEEFWLGQRFLRKELRLGNGFVVGLSDHGEPRIDGLGCWLLREPAPNETAPYPGFSWEWFNRGSDHVFEKLQGKGRIRLGTRLLGGRELVERVEFLDDIVFRMNANLRGKPGEHTHEMLIRKGSTLVFPPEPPTSSATTAAVLEETNGFSMR